MTFENYCRNCGHRILPGEPYCTECGQSTGYIDASDSNVFTFPIHNIGFFDLDIDFSPYIESNRKDFKYEICSCGYLIDVDDDYCSMCGAKKTKSRFSRLFKNKSEPSLFMDNVLCECGAVNSRENIFCEMCGRQLKEEIQYSNDNYSNFNLEFNESVFCFCGEENEMFSQFCRNCGLPLVNYGKSGEIRILCTCSTVNDSTSDFCIECGTSLNKENSVIICICGEKNPANSRFCESCDRPLNPQRSLKTRYICSCGEILGWDTEYCHNCGKNIKKALVRRNSINNTVKSLKNLFR